MAAENVISSTEKVSSSSKRATATVCTTRQPVVEERETFSNEIEFLLSTLGLAIGLGNIWRFPQRAYENGGSAFLFPYIVCAIAFGLPAVYMEFLAGQYQGISPPIVFRRIMPILEGVGWMSAIVSTIVGTYYIVIIAWCCVYIFNIFRGHHNLWSHCSNSWNSLTDCIEMSKQSNCNNKTQHDMVYFNGSCHLAANFNIQLVPATQQYFKKYILNQSDTLTNFSGINWPVLLAMTFCWILTGLLIFRGMKAIGRFSYVTTILPYLLVIVFMIRGVTLPGSTEGLILFFGEPDFTKLYAPRTWSEALKQLCFSLSVGHGGLMSMASYNQRTSNPLKNAAIIIIADTLMSILGGAAVFSILGFLAAERGVPVASVIKNGLPLTFMVFPEALAYMSVPWLWSFLFFLMLFALGISSELAYVEVFCSCIYDQNKFFRNRKWLLVTIWCSFLYACGLIFSTNAGLYWFELFDEYAAGFSSAYAVTIEILCLIYFYGARHVENDILDMIGPPKNKFTAWIGAHSPYYLINWRIISPFIGCILIAFSFDRSYPFQGDSMKYPVLFDILGWLLAFLPTFVVPYFAWKNFKYFKSRGLPFKSILAIQRQHASFTRISDVYTKQEFDEAMLLPENEPWNEGLPSLREDEIYNPEHESSKRTEK